MGKGTAVAARGQRTRNGTEDKIVKKVLLRKKAAAKPEVDYQFQRM